MRKGVKCRPVQAAGCGVLDVAQPGPRSRDIAAAVTRAQHAAHHLMADRGVRAFAADDHRACLVEPGHAIPDVAHRHQGQSPVTQRLALQSAIAEPVRKIKSLPRAAAQVICAGHAGAHQSQQRVALLHARLLALQQPQRAAEPATAYHGLLEPVRMQLPELNRCHRGAALQACCLESPVGAFKLVHRLGEVGRHECHPAEQKPVLRIAGTLDDRTQNCPGAMQVALAKERGRRHAPSRHQLPCQLSHSQVSRPDGRTS